MNIREYSIAREGEDYTLLIRVGGFAEEFAKELGELPSPSKQSLLIEARRIASEKYPGLKIKTVKIIAGTMLVGVMYLNDPVGDHRVNAQTSSAVQTQSTSPLLTYTVKSGDALSLIAKNNGITVTQLKELNNMTSDVIYVGQVLKLPFYSYTVVSGDTLYLLATRFSTTTTAIKQANNMATDILFIGQKLKIPVAQTVNKEPEPAPTTSQTYTVKAGDALSVIAKNYGTTVDAIQQLNNLSTTNIYPGQVLQIPIANTAPVQEVPTTTISYTVQAGDYLSVIAKNYGTTTQEIQRVNNLSTTSIYPGQVLQVPSASQPEPTPEPITGTPTATTYTVKAGDSLSVIAKNYGTTIQDIQQLNQMNSTNIYIGQVLKIPVVETLAPEELPDKQLNRYTVVSGDTLSLIAKSYGTTVTNIKTLNNLSTDRIYVGQTLLIPEREVVPVDATPPSRPTVEALQVIQQENADHYTVKGTTEPNSSLEMVIQDETGATLKTTATSTADGSFTFTENISSLADGAITFSVVAIDGAGNISEETQLTVTKDVLGPQELVLQPKEVTLETINSYPVSGSVQGAQTVILELHDESGQTVQEEVNVTEGFFNKNVDLTSFSDGVLTIRAVAIDAYGNSSSAVEAQVIKDTQKPEAPLLRVPAAINVQNEDQVDIRGVAEPGSTISIDVSDGINTLHEEAVADENGSFILTINAIPFQEGTIMFSAKSTDRSGNESVIGSFQTVKDVTISEVTILDLKPVGINTTSAYDVHGQGDPDTTITAVVSDSEGNTVEHHAVTDENGIFTMTLNLTELQDGSVIFDFFQQDDAGNKSITDTNIVQKDTTAPTAIVVEDPVTIHNQNSKRYSITGQGEPGSTVQLNFKDKYGTEQTHQLKVPTIGTFTLQTDFTQEGRTFKGDVMELSMFQVDEAGNASPVSTKSIPMDLIGPLTVELEPMPIINNENLHSYEVIGTTEQHAAVQVEITDGSKTVYSSVKADEQGSFLIHLDVSMLQDGTLTGHVKTKDVMQNIGDTKDFVIEKDTTVSELLSFEMEEDGRVHSQNVKAYHVHGASGEEGAVVTVEVTDGTNTIKESALVVDGVFSKPLNLSALSEGALQVAVTQKDPAGNVSSIIKRSIEKDTVALQPVLTQSQLRKTTTGYMFTIQGTAERNSTVTIQVAGQTNPITITETAVLDDTGHFQVDLDLSALNGQKPFITVNQVDHFGNESKSLLSGVSSYVVGSGDTLWKISMVLGTSIEELRVLNGLKTDMLYIGQVLKAPMIAGLEAETVSEETVFNMGYLYHGSSTTYMETMQHTQGSVNVVAPTYFDINADGSLKLTQVFDRHFIASMQASGIRVVPFLSNHWDRSLGVEALENRELLSDQIAEAVMLYNLDGVNVDIENVTHEYRDEYTDLVRLLRAKIPADKEVSVAVAANPNNYTLGWHGSYDYAQLGTQSDYLMVMAYDESYPGGKPGPVASLDFVERSIQYAISSGVPKEKIVLGIGHYGRYWREGDTYGGYGISNAQVAEATRVYNGVVSYDEQAQSPKVEFTITSTDPPLHVYGQILKPGNYTIWYENEQSIQAKYELVEKYGIKGTGNWGLEQENPEFWSAFVGWR